MSEILLQARGLAYGPSGQGLLGQGLDLALGAGQCWALLGRNGVGKTSLLRTLAGILPPRAGELRLRDRSLADWRRPALARVLGYLPQLRPSALPLTVAEQVALGGHARGESSPAALRAALAALDLLPLAGRELQCLSGGERQRVALATLWLQAPRVWLLDEPGTHLDLCRQRAVLGALLDRVRALQGTALISLHEPGLAAACCDQVLALAPDGRRWAGPVAQVLVPAVLEAVYGCALRPGAGWAAL